MRKKYQKQQRQQWWASCEHFDPIPLVKLTAKSDPRLWDSNFRQMLGRIRDVERFNRLDTELSFVVADDEVDGVQSSAMGFNISSIPILESIGIGAGEFSDKESIFVCGNVSKIDK